MAQSPTYLIQPGKESITVVVQQDLHRIKINPETLAVTDQDGAPDHILGEAVKHAAAAKAAITS